MSASRPHKQQIDELVIEISTGALLSFDHGVINVLDSEALSCTVTLADLKELFVALRRSKHFPILAQYFGFDVASPAPRRKVSMAQKSA